MTCDHVIGVTMTDYDACGPVLFGESSARTVRDFSQEPHGRFEFCPMCGERLDWAMMLGKATEELDRLAAAYEARVAMERKKEQADRDNLEKLLATDDPSLTPEVRSAIKAYLGYA